MRSRLEAPVTEIPVEAVPVGVAMRSRLAPPVTGIQVEVVLADVVMK
jgi:hypothetical protein